MQALQSVFTNRYAVVANTVTAGGITLVADCLTQTAESQFHEKLWDKERSRNMTILSTAFAPVLHYWYRFLDNKFKGKSRYAVSRKVFLDVAIAPVYYVFYIGGLSKLKNYSSEKTVEEIKDKIPLMVGSELAFWPVLQSINFLVFPPHYRLIGMKFNELVLGVVYSHILNNDYSVRQVIDHLFPKKD
ncbi:unnamed protein product [Clavelina lepadiformis]|uniref:Mpv17-like protein 2 n=1 Tax=Clavelina lepadiformis TaxID=159417 RepID=A0ABP0F106_CLALP